MMTPSSINRAMARLGIRESGCANHAEARELTIDSAVLGSPS
jgi:hypothetical protein